MCRFRRNANGIVILIFFCFSFIGKYALRSLLLSIAFPIRMFRLIYQINWNNAIHNDIKGHPVIWHWIHKGKNRYVAILMPNVDARRREVIVATLRSFSSSSSSLARQPLVGPGLLKKLCPFVSVEGDLLAILDL